MTPQKTIFNADTLYPEHPDNYHRTIFAIELFISFKELHFTIGFGNLFHLNRSIDHNVLAEHSNI